MAAISPKPSSPGTPATPITDWDERTVHSYFVSLGLSDFERAIYEHGITGDVLRQVDNDSLVDLGMTKLGSRLNVLRSVYELKKEQGIEMEDSDWRPQEDVALEAMETAATMDRMWNLVLDQQERLMQLEQDHERLLRELAERGIAPGSSAQGPSIQDSRTPTTALGYRFVSTSQFVNGSNSNSSSAASSSLLTPRPPMASRSASSGALRSQASNWSSRQRGNEMSGSTAAIPSSPVPPVDLPPPTPAPIVTHSADRKKASDDAHHQAKSFRVTMDDPCWKVLPAALKKYKINDDWKMYALFICFGNTERCLSYDEKPLLLFQRLKEGGQRPVFMLRHIRDIKSPIAVAQQKQAVKLGLPANSTTNLLPTIESTLASPTRPTQSANGAGDRPAGRTPGEGTFPELPSPGMRDGSGGAAGEAPKTPGTIVDKNGNVHKVTYAISIYPYIADRQDEFDVAVGATFVVMSKAKGWWFVQKDSGGSGNIVHDQEKSAWVPAGCLLELTAPVGAVAPSSPGSRPDRAPIPPANIMSSSYPGKVLMDYVAKDTNELTLKENERIRVYKKYCHWSYSIKEDTGERGWVPAWFVGKISTEAGAQTATVETASLATAASATLVGSLSSSVGAGSAANGGAAAGGAAAGAPSPGLGLGASAGDGSPGHDDER